MATENFPYGKGETSFIIPELMRLRQRYDITVVSHAGEEQIRGGLCDRMPDGVELICFGRPELSAADKVKALALFVLDRNARQEIREIWRDKRNRRVRLYQSLSFFAQALSDQKRLRESGLLSGQDPVIYYSFWYTYFCYSAVRECGKGGHPNVRLVTRTHGVDLYHERIPGSRQPFKHQMESGLEAILFACDYGKGYYIERIRRDIDEKKLHLCRLGTEAVDAPGHYRRRDVWHVISCSNVIALKRIPLIIDGLSLINEEKIHWTHIGDGTDLEKVKDYAREKLGVKENISYTFQGYLENDQVIQYYREHPADCFITTSATEGGCPVSIQEAMKFGIPVIGTDVGGITEMIRGNGILLSADPDGEEVAAAVRDMISFGEERVEEMRHAGVEIWKREFDIDVNVNKVLHIFNGMRNPVARGAGAEETCRN